MIDSLKNISDSISVIAKHSAKDTLYVVNLSDGSELIKMLPILIAGIALLFSAYSIIISRKALMANIKHQRLSIQPLLTTHEDFSFSNKEGIGLIIKSCGLGPAIIKDFIMLWAGEKLTKSNFNLITQAIGIRTIEVRQFTKDGIIEKDSSEWMLRIPIKQLEDESMYNAEMAGKIMQILRTKLSYTIVYTSIYRDEDYEFTLNYPFRNT